MSKLSLREIAQSQLDSTPVIDGQLIVCLDTGNAYRDTATAHVKIGSDLEVVSDLPLAPLAEKLYYLKPDKLYVFLGGNWTLLNGKAVDLDESIAKLPAGDSTSLNDDVEIITQDTDITQPHYYRRKLVVLWEYIKTKAQDFFAAKNHKHGKADITDFPTSMPASDVYPWAKAATKPSYTKAEVGLGKVDNTADADKSVKRATTAGTADSANSVAWENVKDKPTIFPVEAHNHDDRYYTEAEMNSKLDSKVNNNEAGANGLFSKLGIWTATPTDDTYFIRQDTEGTNQFGRVKFSTIWNYIRGKTDGIYQPKGNYAASSHTHDDRYYTEAEVDGKLSGKSNTEHTHDDRYYTESEINSKLSGKADVNHSHYSITTIADNRNTNTTPNDYNDTLIFQGLKISDKIGSPSSDTYSYLLGLRGWRDASGGNSHELAFNNTGVYWRNGSSEWGGWNRIYADNYHPNADSANYVKDVGTNKPTTFAYSKDGMNYGDYTWLAGWNGYEMRAVNKNQFATVGHTHNYLPLSGGTLSGNIHFADIGSVGTSSGVTWGGSTDGAGIYYQTTSADQGNLVLNLTDDNNCYLRIAQNGNFKSYFSPNDGNFHGNVNGTADVANFAKETYINQYKTVNLTDLDQNTWYPVTGTAVQGNGLRHFKCSVQLNSGSKPSWSTHSAGFTAVVDILEESSGWGTTGMLGEVLINDQRFIADESKPPVGYQQMNFGSIPVWWLRGGGSYRLATDYDCTWTIRKSKYENNGQSVAPTTTYPGVSVNRATITANLNGHANTSEIATVGVRDYNNTNNIIKIGWSGADLDANTLSYVAGYTSDMKIHTASKDGVRSWLGLGAAAYKKIQSLSAVGHSDWKGQSTDDGYVPTMAFMAFWNGAFNGSGSSNLQYCDRGRFGTIVTKSSEDYAPTSGSNNYVRVYNSNNVGCSSSVTLNDLAKQHYAMAMIYNATDNPLGKAAWVHALSMAWTNNNNSSWVSQIALGVNEGNGMWFRTTQGAIAGREWNRVYDSSYHPNANYANSAGSVAWNNVSGKPSSYPPSNHTHAYLPLSGGTISGALTFANGTWNLVGDDAYMGDHNIAGSFCIMGANDTTRLALVNKDNQGDYALVEYGGGNLNFNKKLGANITGHADGDLALSGGTMSGQITKSTGGSWIGDRDRAAIKSSYAGDSAYGAVAAMATKNGYWTIGNLGGWEDLVFNYSTNSNYSAGTNKTSQVRLPAQAGTIITSATIGNQTVNRAEYLANDSAYMRMHWSGQKGQPTWLWGGNDASNMYVWNPSNFSVNYANSAGSATIAWNGVETSGSNYIRFKCGVQICWKANVAIDAYGSTYTFQAAFSAIPAITAIGCQDLDDVFFIRNITKTNFIGDKKGYLNGNVSWIAVGVWK